MSWRSPWASDVFGSEVLAIIKHATLTYTCGVWGGVEYENTIRHCNVQLPMKKKGSRWGDYRRSSEEDYTYSNRGSQIGKIETN